MCPSQQWTFTNASPHILSKSCLASMQPQAFVRETDCYFMCCNVYRKEDYAAERLQLCHL